MKGLLPQQLVNAHQMDRVLLLATMVWRGTNQHLRIGLQLPPSRVRVATLVFQATKIYKQINKLQMEWLLPLSQKVTFLSKGRPKLQQEITIKMSRIHQSLRSHSSNLVKVKTWWIRLSDPRLRAHKINVICPRQPTVPNLIKAIRLPLSRRTTLTCCPQHQQHQLVTVIIMLTAQDSTILGVAWRQLTDKILWMNLKNWSKLAIRRW